MFKKLILASLLVTVSFSQAEPVACQSVNEVFTTAKVVGYSSIALVCYLYSKKTKELPEISIPAEVSTWLTWYLAYKSIILN